MQIKPKTILYFTISYLVVFIVLAFRNGNFEFLYYAFAMIGLIVATVLYYKNLHLPTTLLGGLAISGMLHFAGGNIFINGTKLYDIWLLGGILKYDNFVHATAIFVVTFLMYNILRPYLDKNSQYNKFLLYVVIATSALGVGAFNEVIEFGAVILFDSNGVGNYTNNALDLTFNLVGVVAACIIIARHDAKNSKRKK